MSQVIATLDSKKKSDNIHHSNNKSMNSINHEKIKASNIQFSSQSLKQGQVKKQDSLLSLGQSSDNDDSPQTKKHQLQQIEQNKIENKNKMIEDFKHFIVKQQHIKGNKDFGIEQINNASNVNSYSSSLYGIPTISKFKSDTSLRFGDINESKTHVSFKDDLYQNNQENPQRKINRQNTITQAIQKKLKIFHKSKEHLFNEKLQLFKGVSTYIETKSYLQNLNLLNKKSLIEGMKKNQQWNEEFDQFTQKQQHYSKNDIQEDFEYNDFSDEDEYNAQIKNKFDVENPHYDQNINQLLDKAHKYIKDSKQNNHTRQNKSMNDLDEHLKNQFIQYVTDYTLKNDLITQLENTDENHFYQQLKNLLKQNKQQTQKNKDDEEDLEILKEQQQKKYEFELLNQIYSNPSLSDQLTQDQIQQFIAMQIKQKFEPETLTHEKNVKEKILAGLNIDLKNTHLDAKSQYEEYVEKANHVRKTLQRLNENLFRQKWANAQMKRIQEKEKQRNQIIKKVIDALFPSKRKMQHVKSKVNSNLDTNQDGNFVVRSNSFESSSPKQKQEFLETKTDLQNTQNMIDKKSNISSYRSSHDINSIKNMNGKIQLLNFNLINYFQKQKKQKQPESQHRQTKQTNPYRKKKIINLNNIDFICSLKHIDFKDTVSTKQYSNSVINSPSGFFSQTTKVGLTVEQKEKQKEDKQKQQIKQQQQQLKKEVLQNIAYFQSKKSSAPSLSAIDLPKISSSNTLSSPMKSSHMIKDTYKQYRSGQSEKQLNKSTQFMMNNTLKAPSLLDSTTLKDIDQSYNSPIKLYSKSKTNLDKFINTNNVNSKRNSNYSGCLSPFIKQNDKYFKSANTLSCQNLDPIFDTSAQKGKLISMLTNLESDKKQQRKETKDFNKQITQVQDNCSNDLNKIKGDQIGSMKNLLDIDFLKFSMKSNPHIRDTNIKNFLNKND